MLNMKQKSVDVHSFSMIPNPKSLGAASQYNTTQNRLRTSASWLPILCVEVLPGDHWNCKTTVVARTAVPFVLSWTTGTSTYFAFMVPNRIVWDNWVRMMGEQDDPSSSISYSIPQVVSAAGGFPVGSVYDYFGLPTVGQVGGGATISVNALPLRAYNLIYNQWFRDENLQTPSRSTRTATGPTSSDTSTSSSAANARTTSPAHYPGRKKGNTAVTLPLGTSAPVYETTALLPRGAPWAERCTRTPVHRRHNQHRLERRQRRQHRNRGVGETKRASGLTYHQRRVQQSTSYARASRCKNFWNAMPEEERAIPKSSAATSE